MKALWAAWGVFGIAAAQAPDVRVKLDATLTYLTRPQGSTLIHLYDPYGRTSVLSITLYLEPGLRAFAAERLQPIPGDADRDPLDEYYLEDEGIWRLGKQFLPFGSGNILRESVLAARGDTNLILENLPVSIAICDGGPGAQRGVIGRIGSRIGLSFAHGKHFGIAGTALDYIRRPEDSPGLNRGWGDALGVDASRISGIFTTRFEAVALRNPEVKNDDSLSVLDLSETISPSKYQALTFGWSRAWPNRPDIYRITGAYYVSRNSTFEPSVRYLDGKLYDVAVSLRLKF